MGLSILLQLPPSLSFRPHPRFCAEATLTSLLLGWSDETSHGHSFVVIIIFFSKLYFHSRGPAWFISVLPDNILCWVLHLVFSWASGDDWSAGPSFCWGLLVRSASVWAAQGPGKGVGWKGFFNRWIHSKIHLVYSFRDFQVLLDTESPFWCPNKNG